MHNPVPRLAWLVVGVLAVLALAINFFPSRTFMALGWMNRWLTAAFWAETMPTEHRYIRRWQEPWLYATVPYRDPEGYAVMSAWRRQWAKDSPIIFQAEISPDPHLRGYQLELSCFPEDLRDEYRDSVDQFNQLNSLNWSLEQHFAGSSEPPLVVPHSALKQAVARIDGKPGYTQDVHGYFILSAVGFNRNHDRAVLYVRQDDGHWGWGDYFAFRKVGEHWIQIPISPCGWIA